MKPAASMLIVEDDANDLNLLKRAFRKSDLQASYEVAEDGDAAVAALERAVSGETSIPRVVLLDLKLPRRSGFEVLMWMKEHPQLRRVPVVILTSSDRSSDLTRAYDLGANSYLVKPAIPTALAAMAQQIDRYWLQLNAIS